MAADLKGLVGDSRAVACGIMASRISGFGRIAATAAVLGPTFFGNLFQTAAVLPSTLYGLLMGTLVSAVLVPPLVRHINRGDHEAAHRFARTALGMMLVALFSVGVLGMLLSPMLLRIITVSVADPEIRRQQVHLGVPLLIMLLPQIALYGLAGAGLAVQQAHGRFALAAAAPTVENLVNIAVLVASAVCSRHRRRRVANQPGAIAASWSRHHRRGCDPHAGVQWFGAYRVGIALWPRLDWADPEVPQAFCAAASRRWAIPGLDWSAYLIALVIAGTIPGGVAAYQIATSFCSLPAALLSLSR